MLQSQTRIPQFSFLPDHGEISTELIPVTSLSDLIIFNLVKKA